MPSGVREARAELTASDAKLDPALRRGRRKFKSFGDGVKRDLRSSFRGVTQIIGGLTGIGSAAALISVGKQVMKFESNLNRLQIASNRSASQMAELRSSINAVSRETGVGREELLAGASQYVALTGDIEGAEKAIGLFGRVSAASGASMEDVSATAASLQQNLKIDPADFEKAFSILIAGGKAGAIELKDLAGLMSSIAPSFSQFGVTGKEGMAQLGAMLQLARQGFGSAAETVTGVEGMMTGFVKNAKKFESAGVKIFSKNAKTGRKEMRPLLAIVEDLGKSKLMKDPTKLAAAFGRIEGLKTFQELVKIPGALDALIAKTSEANDVSVDFHKRMESDTGKVDKAIEGLKVTIAEAFTPERIQKFANALTSVAGAADQALSSLSAMWGLTENFLDRAADRKKFRDDAIKKHGFFKGMQLASEHRGEKTGGFESGLSVEAFEKRKAHDAMWGTGVLSPRESVAAATRAQRQSARTEALSQMAQQSVNITITVDQAGMLKADAKQTRDKRRKASR